MIPQPRDEAPTDATSPLVLPAHVARKVAAERELRARVAAVDVLFREARQARDRLRAAELEARPHRSRGARKRIARRR